MFNQLKDKDEDLDESETHDNVSKRAGKIEKVLVNNEPKPLDASEELLSRLEKELSKITTKGLENEKSTALTDDLLKKIDKLSQVIDLESDVEKQSEIIENKENNEVTPQPNKRILTYRRRNGGENSESDRT